MKAALITGSARRLGRDIAIALGARGYFTWIHYRNSKAQAASTLALIRRKGGSGELIQADIGDPTAVKNMVGAVLKTSRRIDVLINNVGHYQTGNLLRLPAGHFERTLRTNLFGAYYIIHELHSRMSPGGSIINIGYTGLGSLAASPYATAYNISKTGLLLLTRSYADLLGKKKIRVNMVSPGQQENSVDLPANLQKLVPLKRAGKSRDITQMIEFLVSDKADYVTGQNIEVSGGFMQTLRSNLKKR